MTVSMRVLSAGDGVAYLLRSVVSGDGDRSLARPLTRYYAEAGTPPGTWMGSGVMEFGAGELRPDDTVTAGQLQSLLGAGRDPVTAEGLGRPFPTYAPLADRIAERVARLDGVLSRLERAAAVATIEGEEAARGTRQAVAGFDLTFSVPKSVSVLWGVTDAATQTTIVEAHHAAVDEVLAFFEREVAVTRVGADSGQGLVAQVGVVGVAATAFDHYDSRAGDPQLHTHVVVSNKVKTATDGKWRTLDSRQVHASVVALSEYYSAVLTDRITAAIGVGWQQRQRQGTDRSDKWEISGVSEELVAEFSSRNRDIEVATDSLIAAYVAQHGRRPSKAGIVRLRAQATLATRPDKEIRSLEDLTAEWRQRAEPILHANPTAWARGLTTGRGGAALSADRLDPDLVREVGAQVLAVVSEKRSTWRHWNLWAEASRQTMGWRFATIEDRELVVTQVVEAAESHSVALSPPELASSPVNYTREDGSSVFRPKRGTVYSSTRILDAEDRLLERSETRTAPTVATAVVERLLAGPHDGRMLSEEQCGALTSIATSGRLVDLLVGPAGAGKTTAMRALLATWTAAHGPGSVVGLAPSAAAAAVLAEDLGIGCDNTAKWLYEHERGRTDFRAGQLVILDEATLAGTATLEQITGRVEAAGAKALLVGDSAQLQSVDAGGAFALLASSRDDVPELGEVHRFTHDWEKAASLALRAGNTHIIATYDHHDRIRSGNTEEMVDAAYAAWHADLTAGLSTLLVTDSTETVRLLNERARAERLQTGESSTGRDIALAGDVRASVGDLVITRRNTRTLLTARGDWVRNGDRWRVTDVHRDGALTVRRQGRRFGASVVLPAAYVAEHVDLGYAVTAHRAQGMTVDTAYVVVTSGTTRENLYVSMTRGREGNHAYVALDRPDDLHVPPPTDDIDASVVLAGVLQYSGTELSAHQVIAEEQDRWSGIAQLAAEYETLATDVTRERYESIVRDAVTGVGGMTDETADDVVASEAFGPLAAQMRYAEAGGADLHTLVAEAVGQRGLDDADDIAAVLHHRLHRATSDLVPDLFVGMIPAVRGDMPADVQTVLDERRDLMETRARHLAVTDLRAGEPWTAALGAAPISPHRRALWLHQLQVVAAYRDRYNITSHTPLGGEPTTTAQHRDAVHATLAIRTAVDLAEALADELHDDALSWEIELA